MILVLSMKKVAKTLSLGLLLLSGVGFVVANNSKLINEAEASTLTNDGYDTNDYHYYSGTYYDSIGNSAISTGGTTLLSALCTKIQPSSAFGYDNLWTLYETSDVYPNNYDGTDPLTGNSYPTTKTASGYRGKIWDMYGDTQYTVGGSAQGASYKKVGDAYNREHTVPQSWFSENSIPRSDPHHIFATDGYVNNQRGNYPYGDVNGSPNVLTNGFGGTGSPVGTYGSCGSSTVFEPEDAYKGDIARAVLYMAAAYYNYGTSFATSNSCFTRSGNNNILSSYYINLLTKWSAEDPVSQKEIDRNNVIFGSSQANRNPFIDHPNWTYKIWGGTQYTWNNGSTPSTDPSASISPSSASVQVGKTVNLTATLSNVTSASNITWDSSDTSKATVEKGTTSTSSSIATVTGVAAGTATIRCKHSGTTIGSVTVTVTSSGGGGGSDTSGTLTITRSSFATAGGYAWYDWSQTTSGSTNISGKAELYTTATTSMQFNKSKGDKVSAIFNTTALPGPITTIEATTASGTNRSWNAYVTSTACSASGSTLTFGSNKTTVGSNITIGTSSTSLGTTNAGYTYFCLQENESNVSYLSEIKITYGSKTLNSISVSTAPTKTTYTAGENFDPTGLVIRRNYSDSTNDTYSYSGHTSEFTFTPSTSTALATDNTSVTIGYGGKTTTQSITVNAPAVTSITASVSKTFYAGETISTSDITVKDNNNNTVAGFTFDDDNYQFLYSDASNGGALTSKTFTNKIHYNTLNCSLTVQVQRKAYVAPSSTTDTITASDLTATNTSYTNFSNVSKTSGAKYAGNSAKDSSGNIQMRSSNSNSGIVSTMSGGSITSVTITVGSGSNTVQVYGKNSAYSAATDLYSNSTQGTLVGYLTATGTVNFTTSYSYVGIRSSSGAIYLSSVTITYGTSQTPTNVANYIMYTDTENQCTSKFTTAKGYFEDLSKADRTTFMTSDDYVISTARERFQAWAAHEGKSITLSDGDYVISSNTGISFAIKANNDTTSIVTIIVSLLSITALGGFLLIKHRKEENLNK